MTAAPDVMARHWLDFLEGPEASHAVSMHAIYGSDPAVLSERFALHARVVRLFLERFGDRPLRLFRAPARINLRGMHVDTHGGYLNLMTHQRETVLAVSPVSSGPCRVANVDSAFQDIVFDGPALLNKGRAWETLLSARASVGDGWARYVAGAWLRAHAEHATAPQPVCAVVGSDIPRGAALSSSHALSLVGFDAYSASLGRSPGALERIAAARDVEWFAGARTGTSDQGTMVLGQRDKLIHAVLHPDALDLSRVNAVAFPADLAVLVIDSRTQRNLSGAAALAYNRNRFAYSLGLAVMRQVWMRSREDAPPACFADITPATCGGLGQLYGLLAATPVEADLDRLREQYDLPGLHDQYARYFAHLPEAERPTHFDLRGPLLFGIAESERARVFRDYLAAGDYVTVGHLMNAGHDGDRVVWAGHDQQGRCPADGQLEELAREGVSVEWLPGRYEASAPPLDALVDVANRAGALGACLTGAGIAGCVLALCRREDVPAVTDALRMHLASPAYARLAGLPAPLDAETATNALVVNQAVAGAGELLVQ